MAEGNGSVDVEQMESVTDLVEVQERAADVPEDSECAMSEGWMQELLEVFTVLVDRTSKPAALLEECDLLAINMNNRYQNINFDKFKPVMLAALRSLLPKTWSTTHETAWEWLWFTISRNLVEATTKVKTFKPYNAHLFNTLGEEQFEHFRISIFTDFFSKCATSQEWFKQSQTRLRYIADRVIRSSYDMFHTSKEEMMDDLSGLGLRHVGYGVPIELFAPFTDSCVIVMKRLISDVAQDETVKLSLKVDAASSKAHGLQETDASDIMLEGFRWSIGLVSRVLMRTITEGSTAVMYAIIVADIANISIQLCEFKVLCSHAFKQVVLCLGAVTCVLTIFAFAISSMTREATLLTSKEFAGMGCTMTSLVQLAVGIMDMEKIGSISGESPYLLVVLVAYMLVVYSFFFNLLVSQFCGIYTALAADIQGYAMLARGEVILDTLKAIPMKRWQHFITSLRLDQRVDFEEGDIGLPGGIKTWEPSLAHPTTQDQIIRAGGDTDPSLPWPINHSASRDSSMEKVIKKTIQKSLQKYLGKSGLDSTTDGSKTSGQSSHSSSNQENHSE